VSKSGFSRIGAGGKKRYGKRGAGLFMTDGDVVLLLKRKPPCDQPNTWAIPGGKVKSGESDIGAAHREAKEESGNLPSMTRIDDFTDQDGHHVFKTYLMTIEKPYNVKLSDESSDYEWVPLSHITSKNLHPGVRRIWPDVARAIARHYGKGKS
jgi:8-oxo-dGTP pyrophosphatase MutT (NUDIX family)